MSVETKLEEFLQFCKGAALLRQSGVSVADIASQLSLEKSKAVLLVIAVGLMPEYILDSEIRTHPEKWTKSYLMLAASLRRTKPGKFLSQATRTEDLDFTLVLEAIKLVNQEVIVGVRDLLAYVTETNSKTGRTKSSAVSRLEKKIRKQIKEEQAASIPQIILSARHDVDKGHLLRLSVLYQLSDLLTETDLSNLVRDIEREIEALSHMKLIAESLTQSNIIIHPAYRKESAQ